MTNQHDITAEQLRLYIDRIERMEAEKKEIAQDISDVYKEAKSQGYDVKAIKTVIKIRGLEANQRQEQDALVSLYREKVGV